MADEKSLKAGSTHGDVQAFLAQLERVPCVNPSASKGRLLFAVDATASREPVWSEAREIQARMFEAAANLGGLEIQLCFYRGYDEFEATPWIDNPNDLRRRMAAIACLGGYTQIERVLRHAVAEARLRRVNALVFVGDCVEEPADRLCRLAGELGLLGLPIFAFHEGDDTNAKRILQQLAQLSRGAYCRFDQGSASQLLALLRAVAVYAAGGRAALEAHAKQAGPAVQRLTRGLGS